MSLRVALVFRRRETRISWLELQVLWVGGADSGFTVSPWPPNSHPP